MRTKKNLRMNLPKYDTLVGSDATAYEFTSTGQNGDILKAVIYDTTKQEDIYNLGFGNIVFDKESGQLLVDDQVVDNNGDMREILATVAHTAYQFSLTYPELKIFIRGSDKRRTKVYKRAINTHIEELSKTFHIFGALIDADDNITDAPFDYNQDFDGFLFKRK